MNGDLVSIFFFRYRKKNYKEISKMFLNNHKATIRAKISAEIIRKALINFDAMLYGGFIRDSLSGRDFTDIDIFFQEDNLTSNLIPAYIQSLKYMGYNVLAISEAPYFLGTNLWLHKYEINKYGITIPIDLTQRVRPLKQQGLFPFCSGSDVDINNLYLEKGEQVKLWGEYPSTFDKVFDNVQRGYYEAEPTVAQHRIDKVEAKGFKLFSISYVGQAGQSGTFSSPKKPEVKCKQCRNTVYVDDAKCWWCQVDSPGVM